MSESHAELPGSRRLLQVGARRLRDADPQAHMEVTITLKGRKQPGPDDVLGPTMTPKEMADQFGASPEDLQKVESVLRSYGLTVQDVLPNGRSLRVSGTVAAMEAAFNLSLGIYQHPEIGEYRGREGSVMIPSELSNIVTGVFGLDQRRVARHHLPAVARSPQTGLTPSDCEKRYNFPSGDGSGQTIAIAEFGQPLQPSGMLIPAYLPDDLTAFCKAQSRPVPNVQIVPVNIAPINHDQLLVQLQQMPQLKMYLLMSTLEVMMDVEILAGLCPKAQINVYFASFDQKGWIDLLDEVTAGRPGTPVCLSISYGAAEDDPTGWTPSALQEINSRLQAAAMEGITVCVSSGDDGSGCMQPGSRVHVEFPGSSPNVCCVGGTMIAGKNEVVWWQAPGFRTNKGGGATGGGVSAIFQRPSWQNVTVTSLNPGSMVGRVIPDVAAVAGPPFFEVTFLGKTSPIGGGTSASAPLWAALLARINAALPAKKRQRFLAPLLYQDGANGAPRGQSGCRDITTGQNASDPRPGKGYQATVGYDAVSGWGAPNGKALLGLL